MEILNKPSKEKWENAKGYQWHVTISSTKPEEIDGRIVYIEDLEKRKKAYGICGECNEPGTGKKWCQACNAKRGGFGKIYLAERPEGYITGWDIENQKWQRGTSTKVVLKSLDNSSGISKEFLNEIKSHIQIYFWGILQCYGITQDPNTKDYMMVLPYCEDGSLRNYYLNNHKEGIKKIYDLFRIANGLLDIHNAGKVHKDFHSDLIMKCWDATAENRPTTKELYEILIKWNEEKKKRNSEIYSQLKEYDKINKNKLESGSSNKKSENVKSHSQAIYTSRLLNFRQLPEPSSQLYSDATPSVSANPISECLDVQLSELDLIEIEQDENNIIDDLN
ncbi:kinase-like domain-containing protein [Rhizophagus irregularis DAOM 181602=DAOM 197198]|nr:kinase-like domain-containing protein [Rhizophagus irregularis DAOM 181602=DAOM 197198]